MTEDQANEVMADIEGREITHREDTSAGFDHLLRHLTEMHRLRDRYFYAQLSAYPETSEIYKQVTEMQTW